MKIADILLQDFDLEMLGTRTTLERIPEDKADYKPHEKSMPMGRLAVHVDYGHSLGADAGFECSVFLLRGDDVH